MKKSVLIFYVVGIIAVFAGCSNDLDGKLVLEESRQNYLSDESKAESKDIFSPSEIIPETEKKHSSGETKTENEM